ncbi:MAG: lysophospholipid acyltransferase family protein [Desulfosarcinaceae bacterium]
MKLKLRSNLSSELLVTLLYRLSRIYSATLRLRIENEAAWLNYLHRGGRVLLCAWHQQFFSAIRHFQTYGNYRPGIMISRSRDGSMIAGVARRSGWRPVRGSSSKGSRAALRKMIHHLERFRLAGHIVDGPRGPAGKVKAGVIRMAQATGAVIVPFYVSADRRWLFNSWDRFLLPKPFSRVTLRFDAPIHLEADLDNSGFEGQRRRLETIMRPGLIL